MCCHVWSLQRRRARAQTSLAVLWRCLRIGPTTGRLARSPDSRSLLRTVWPEIRTFARPGVLRAVSSVAVIWFWRWIRRKCLSWRCDVTRGLPLRGLSFVLLVCRRRISSLEMVIIDTLKWYATAWWVIPVWTIPTARWRDVIVCFVRINAFHKNIDVNDNKQFVLVLTYKYTLKISLYRFFCWLVYHYINQINLVQLNL
jgi:hypothetical protein